MNVGMTTDGERMCPCFSGACLWILDQDEDIDRHWSVATGSWQSLGWSRQLMRLDVGVVLCVGVDQFLWGALKGYGIEVVPNAVGRPSEVLKQWRRGELVPPDMWPVRLPRCGGGRRRRLGFRGGRTPIPGTDE